MMRTGEPLSRAQFRQLGFHVLDRAAHPFQFCVLELLLDECCAHLVVAIDGAVVALSGFVQLDLVILDGGGLELLGDALLYVARCLPYFQKAIVRLVINRISVDARRATGFGVSISSIGLLIAILCRGGLVEQFTIVLGNLRLNKSNFGGGNSVSLVKLGISPFLGC